MGFGMESQTQSPHEVYLDANNSETQDVGGWFGQNLIVMNAPNHQLDVPSSSAMPKIRSKKRGMTKLKWVVHHPEIMTFNGFGQPQWPRSTCARFSRFLGITTRDHSLFPINVTAFRDFHHGDNLERAWNRVKVFILPTCLIHLTAYIWMVLSHIVI